MKHKLYNRLLSLALALGLLVGMLPGASAVVNDPGTHPTHTYNFYTDETIWNTQILSEGEKLNQPKTPSKDGQVFEGWYTEKTGGELFTDYDVEGSLTQNLTTNLYARYSNAYYVFYKDGKDGRILYTQTYGNGDTVDWSDVPYATSDVNEALIGWSTNPSATTPDSEVIINGADITLYPVIANAHWITYHSQGGSLVEPAYVLAGDTTVRPEDPTRQGYSFDGWYTNPECTIPFTFGSELKENVDLYAKWTPGQSRYTVVYWLENADDDGYTYKEKVDRTGSTGSIATYEEKKYEHFTLNKSKTDQDNLEISGDGTTVKNVYYSRNKYTITFVKDFDDKRVICGKEEHKHNLICQILGCKKEEHTHSASCYVYTDPIYTVTRKYDADISDVWSDPIITSWADKGYVWRSSITSKYYSFLQKMPEQDIGMEATKWSGNKYTWDYYLEALDGKAPSGQETITDGGRTYYRYHTTVVYGSGLSLTYDEDYFPITGFTQRDRDVPDFNKNRYARLFYTRNSYKIDFNTNGGVSVPSATNILFEANLSSKKPTSYIEGVTTKKVDGQTYYFAGWYDNEALGGEKFDFNQNMPAHDILLYAKWDTKKVTVTFDVNGGTPEIEQQTISYGTTAARPEDPTREGYQFAGWTRNGTPFNFGTPITEDTTLVAQWISAVSYSITYDPGAGTGEPVTDEKMYASGTNAKVLNVPDSFTAPTDYVGFVCWNTKEDGTGTNYYPGAKLPMPESNVTLYAQWAPKRETVLIYDYNDGSGTQVSETIVTPNGQYKIDHEPARSNPGWRFVGWSTEQNPANMDNLLQKGDIILVDTLNPETNILYAQWEKTGTLTITKTVEGLDAEALAKLKTELKFTISDDDPSTEDKVIGSENITSSSGNSFTYKVDGLSAGEYAVTEKDYDTLENYKWVSDKSYPITTKVEIVSGTEKKISFSNSYESKTAALTITKQIDGKSFGDGRDDFSFKIVSDDGTVYYVHINGANSETITLPTGEYTVTELDNQNYDCEVGPKAVTLTANGAKVTFTNKPNETRIPTDSGATQNNPSWDDTKKVITWNKEQDSEGNGQDLNEKPTE